MNNTKTTLALVAVFMAATLVVGTLASTATTQTALAYQQKKRGGSQDGSRDGNTVTLQACEQDGTESGFDNSLAQECENLICTHPGENATCVQEGAAAASTPVKLTCEQCFTKFLSSGQITLVKTQLSVDTLDQLCALLSSGRVGLVAFKGILSSIGEFGVPAQVQIELIQCLKDAGIVFPT